MNTLEDSDEDHHDLGVTSNMAEEICFLSPAAQEAKLP